MQVAVVLGRERRKRTGAIGTGGGTAAEAPTGAGDKQEGAVGWVCAESFVEFSGLQAAVIGGSVGEAVVALIGIYSAVGPVADVGDVGFRADGDGGGTVEGVVCGGENAAGGELFGEDGASEVVSVVEGVGVGAGSLGGSCLLYTSDAADE